MNKDRLKNAVKKYLEIVPKTRDDDPLLYCYLLKEFWYERDHVYHQMQKLSPESVQRCRRKWQEQEPSLRWKKYEMRKHLEQEKRAEYAPWHLF